jgi:beta-lactamase superfamily II metal-dependent hydrolase
MVPVLERYEVDRLLYAAKTCRGTVCGELQALVQRRGIAFYEPVDGLSVDLGGAILRVLGVGEDRVLRLEYGGTCFMLAASAGPEALAALAARRADLRCDVLQMDARSTASDEGAAFVEAVRPALVVLTGDLERVIEIGDLGAQVVHVADRQSLTVESDGRQYVVR